MWLYRVVLQYELDGVEFDQLPDTAVANRQIIEQLQSLLSDDCAGSPTLEVSHSEGGRGREGGREGEREGGRERGREGGREGWREGGREGGR